MLIGQDHFFQKTWHVSYFQRNTLTSNNYLQDTFLKVRDENTAEPLKQQPHKMVDATADELFECV